MLKKLALFFLYSLFLLMVFLSLLAPYFEHCNNHTGAAIVYFGMRPLCHQLPERTFFVWGYKMALCSRCFSIYVSFLFFSFLFFIFRKRFKGFYWKTAVFLFIPMALDGTTQLVGLRESTQLLRVLTGSLFGLGFALIICPLLFDLCLDDYKLTV